MTVVPVTLLVTAALVLWAPVRAPGIPWHSVALASTGGVVGALVAATVVGTPVLVLVSAIVGASAPSIRQRHRRDRRRARTRAQWPDAIDVVRSAVRSGATLADAMAGAAARVPGELAPGFRRVAAQLSVGVAFAEAVSQLAAPDDPVGQRVVAVVTLSDEMGSADTGRVLSALADFVRSDLAQQREIAARHSWNVAAARIAVVAPWLTAAALSLQPTARAAYASSTGSALLAAVAVISVVAYAAMNRMGRTRDVGAR